MNPKISVKNLHLHYGDFHALKGVSIEIRPCRVTAIIGPSGCGKSTFLRCLNRMNDTIEGVKTEGLITIDGEEILHTGADLIRLRKKVGMVFQRPNPFPLSIFENVAFGPKLHGVSGPKKGGRAPSLEEIVEKSLRAVNLWDELKDLLKDSALRLSLEQQQRLCIARLLAVNPEVLLMDEPCSALDPVATLRIEELIHEMKKDYTIVIVTHNMQQAARISGETAYFYLGELIEFGRTDRIFTSPEKKETEDYITGRFG
ncbi:MAG: phosphate ABC transporter ATP-binding protein [Candidatus Omnitrophica bacterium]|nr:phosphate ABC transporter ATP-binding protein [Candidatus Omnitrophota bacterium]